MRRLRGMLAATVVAATGCSVPSTLGLPCLDHSHCDPGQHCGDDDICQPGQPPTSTPVPTPQPTTSATGTTTTASDGSSSTGMGTTLVLDGTSSSGGSTTETGSTDSTGAACGQAIGSCDAMDLLFVIDNSSSMMEDNAVLIPALASVQALLVEQLEGMCTYHVGVTTTEPMLELPGQEGCQVRGALSRAGALCENGPWEDDPTHVPWVSEHDDINDLGCLFGVLQNQEDDEKQLDTILAALGPTLQGPGGCNEGFLREGVPLMVILVTDEDDDDDSGTPGESADRTGSALSPGNWWDALTAIKPANQLAMVVLAATTPGGCGWSPQLGNGDGTGAEYAQNLLEFLGYFFGAGYGNHYRTLDLCQPVDELVAQVPSFESILMTVCEDAAR